MSEQAPPFSGYDQYITHTFAAEDAALAEARHDMERGNLPEINVSASEGKLLHMLARLFRPERILEIGTLGGYSAIWLARALPTTGKMVSLELDAHHADVARQNLERASLGAQVEVRVGPASETLARMAADGEPLFDLVFIDADKDGYVDYLNAALPLLRPGGLLLGDNTLPDAVLDPAATSGTKRYNTAVAAHPDLDSILIPVLRSHGIDGLLVSIKRENI
jgi:predicted O-methyltransferase YrrM